MSDDANAAVVRRLYEEVVNGGRFAVAEEVFAPHYRRHDADLRELPPGPAGFCQLISAYRTAFPDLRIQIDDLIACREKVVVRWTAEGTHRGELVGHAPTGRRVRFGGISIYRLAGGRIVEDWVERDMHGLRNQLATPVTVMR